MHGLLEQRWLDTASHGAAFGGRCVSLGFQTARGPFEGRAKADQRKSYQEGKRKRNSINLGEVLTRFSELDTIQASTYPKPPAPGRLGDPTARPG